MTFTRPLCFAIGALVALNACHQEAGTGGVDAGGEARAVAASVERDAQGSVELSDALLSEEMRGGEGSDILLSRADGESAAEVSEEAQDAMESSDELDASASEGEVAERQPLGDISAEDASVSDVADPLDSALGDASDAEAQGDTEDAQAPPADGADGASLSVGDDAASGPLVPVYTCGDDTLYAPNPIGAWRVCVSLELQGEEPELSAQVLERLEEDLVFIAGFLEASITERLQEVQIWIEREIPGTPGAVYHPSANWLVNNGYPAYWAEGVQLANAENYLSWTDIQPAIVFHELSHAWHHQVLGYNQGEIKAAYEAAMAAEIYAEVAYAGGGTLEAYATQNHIEYFAELSEAYFWTNDFYPFNKAELEAFDPQGYAAVEEAWQPLE